MAYAVYYNMDYLLSWNCSHLSNAEILKGLLRYNNKLGLETPIICTIDEIMPYENFYDTGGATMWKDPIVKEVREAGAELSKECNYDIYKFGEMLRKHEEEYKKQGWKFVTKEELIEMELIDSK